MDTQPDLNLEWEAVACCEAKARTEAELRQHPEKDPTELATMYLQEARRELGLT